MADTELKAVLFDFDGTLVDSEPVYDLVFNKWMYDQGFSFDMQDQINAQIVPGITWLDVLSVVQAVTKQTLDTSKLISELNARIEQYIVDVGVPLKEGVREALEQLSQQYRLAIVSSSYQNNVMRALKHHRLEGYFEHVTTFEHITHPKPHPEPYLYTLTQLNLKPAQAVAVEDSLFGAQSAAAAGVFTYVWPSPEFKPEQFASFAKVVFSFEEVTKDLL